MWQVSGRSDITDFEEHLWETVLLYTGVRFKTYSGLPFTYEIRKGRSGEYTKELWIDRREKEHQCLIEKYKKA